MNSIIEQTYVDKLFILSPIDRLECYFYDSQQLFDLFLIMKKMLVNYIK